MPLRIFMVLLLSSVSISAMSLGHDNSTCNIDSTYLEIYTRAVRQVFEILASSKKIEKDDVEIYPIEPDTFISVLNSGFDTNIFSKACFVTGKMYTFRYRPPSYVRFGLYQLAFDNNKDMEYAAKILSNERSGYLPKTELVISFTWHKRANSIFIIMETNLVGQKTLEQLK